MLAAILKTGSGFPLIICRMLPHCLPLYTSLRKLLTADLLEVLLPLGERFVCWKEVGHKLLPGLVHHTPDHCLGHHLQLLGLDHAHRSRIGVENYLQTGC